MLSLLCFILLLASVTSDTSQISACGGPLVSKCFRDNVDENVYTQRSHSNQDTYGRSTNCYFVVNGPSYTVYNGKTQDAKDMYKIDLYKARKICDAHGAWLPVILTKSEFEFLWKQYAPITPFILLGLERPTFVNYIWDSMNGPTFIRDHWLPKWAPIKDKAVHTYTLLMTDTGEWTEFYPNKTLTGLPDNVPVICHQRSYDKRELTRVSDTKGHWVPTPDKEECEKLLKPGV